ncbi:protein NUCLEAR FUSION DEFECTIVE 6, mitochondrial-like [Rutidosis leptorrhynchoides]|uniref:protein NUCLEAR FUSION DEFECTIVE 6, mitochondrial-like n=1 Tax=Rutidosis leptorrhynchoides TaxID=125765 RepID=UPI003A9961A9
MASSSGRQVLQRARSFISSTRRIQSQSTFIGTSPAATRNPSSRFSSRRKPIFSSREPVELSCAQSLMPLHSATASSLLKSMLSSKVGQWGTLSEGFATPL